MASAFEGSMAPGAEVRRPVSSAVTGFDSERSVGFAPAPLSVLPARRQALYNYRRGSKVLAKTL